MNKPKSRAAKPRKEPIKGIAAMKFRGMEADISKIDREWEQQRGVMARIALLVMRDNDTQLALKFCKNDEAAKTGLIIIDQLQEEAQALKTGIQILESAMARLMIVVSRGDTVVRKDEPAHE